MPTYVYRCPNGHEREETWRMDEADLLDIFCEEPGCRLEMRRAIQAPSVIKVSGGTPNFHGGRR